MQQNDEHNIFWLSEQSSLRASEIYLPNIFKRKAEEFASLFTPKEMKFESIDLGCGAGEILKFLINHLNIKEGIDISKNNLEQARKELVGSDISFNVADALEYVSDIDYRVWLSAAGINQFLKDKDIDKIISIFVNNKSARSIFLFDTIDPAKYLLMNSLLISYRPQQVRQANKYRLLRAFFYANKLWSQSVLFYNKQCIPLKKKMGYAFRPSYWMLLSERYNLSLEIVGSRYLEYRYHVILRKKV